MAGRFSCRLAERSPSRATWAAKAARSAFSCSLAAMAWPNPSVGSLAKSAALRRGLLGLRALAAWGPSSPVQARRGMEVKGLAQPPTCSGSTIPGGSKEDAADGPEPGCQDLPEVRQRGLPVPQPEEDRGRSQEGRAGWHGNQVPLPGL